jgi:ferredoxin
MNAIKVWIEEGCIACGVCEEVCPVVFKVDDIAHINPDIDYSNFIDSIKDASEICPLEIIKYLELDENN